MWTSSGSFAFCLIQPCKPTLPLAFITTISTTTKRRDMFTSSNNNDGYDTSKLQMPSAPPPVTAPGASGANAGTGAGAGAGYGGYAESTGLNAGGDGKTAYGAGPGPGAGSGAAYNNNNTSGTAPAPPPVHAGGYNAGTNTNTGAGGAKTYGLRAYNRFIKPGGRAGSSEKEWDVPLAILAIFVPPLAVFFKVGLVNIDFVINVCLTILAWFPGVLHAWYVIFVQRKSRTGTGPTDTTTYGANARAKVV